MHIEIEVALNFIISYLYNKLPRRRVNIFGEELEKALKHKFQGHWYPDKPVKGSAFRCFKTGDTPDPVLEIAAVQSGVPSADILENLPHELSVWIDPGEVSYRVGEKGIIKILYSAANAPMAVPVHEDYCSAAALALEQQQQQQQQQEVSRTFNPEAQCFKPMESLSAKFGNMSVMADKFKGLGSGSDSGEDRNSNSDNSEDNFSDNSRTNGHGGEGYLMEGGGGGNQNNGGASTFLQRSQPPSTFTIASFAATKFGSTKLKTSSKRNNRQFSSRMSPVEFSNYLKQRTNVQQPPPFLQSPNATAMMGGGQGLQPLMSPSRSLSPAANHHTAAGLSINSDPFYYHNSSNGSSGGGYYPQQQQQPFLGSHHQQQLQGYGTNPGGAALATATSPSSANAISSSITSISSASSSSASSSVSSSSLGDHLMPFGGPFGNRQMYNFYAANEAAAYADNGFFGSLSAGQSAAVAAAGATNQLEDSVPATSMLEGNPKFGVIGGGLSAIGGGGGPGELSMDNGSSSSSSPNDTHNNAGDTPASGASSNPGTPLENLQTNSNNFYSGSSNSAFPQLLVAN